MKKVLIVLMAAFISSLGTAQAGQKVANVGGITLPDGTFKKFGLAYCQTNGNSQKFCRTYFPGGTLRSDSTVPGGTELTLHAMGTWSLTGGVWQVDIPQWNIHQTMGN